MTPADAQQAAKADALSAAARALRRFAATAAVHATSKPLFQRVIKLPGSRPLVFRIVWPGVALLLDPEDGAVVAESEPGKPDQLKAGFVPGRTLE